MALCMGYQVLSCDHHALNPAIVRAFPQGSVMRLDLCDREGKYSNGFCHWPQCAWRRADGTWQPASANFTSLATPNAIGSGKTALATLLHEGEALPLRQ